MSNQDLDLFNEEDIAEIVAQIRAARDTDEMLRLCDEYDCLIHSTDPTIVVLRRPMLDAIEEMRQHFEATNGPFIVVHMPYWLTPTTEEKAELRAADEEGSWAAVKGQRDLAEAASLRMKAIDARIKARLTISRSFAHSEEALADLISLAATARSKEELGVIEDANRQLLYERLTGRQYNRLCDACDLIRREMDTGPIKLYYADGTYAGHVQTSEEARRWITEQLRAMGAHGSYLYFIDPDVLEARNALMQFNDNALGRLTAEDRGAVHYAAYGPPIRVIRPGGKVFITMDLRQAAKTIAQDLRNCSTPGAAMGLWHGNAYGAVGILKEYATRMGAKAEYAEMLEAYELATKGDSQ
jgi:hypothetical protein